MKYLLIIFAIILSGVLFWSNADAQTCRSEKRGHCVELASLAQAQMLEEFFSKNVLREPGDIIPALYKFGLGLVGVSALGALIVGGVYYMTAGGSQDRAKKGRTWLGNAVFGLVLALLSFLILNTINPDFLKRLDLKLEPIGAYKGPLGQDESGRNIGDPGSSAVIGRKGETPNSNLIQQCLALEASGCKLIPANKSGSGETICDCAGDFRGQSGP